jgi:hypothetical protein
VAVTPLTRGLVFASAMLSVMMIGAARLLPTSTAMAGATLQPFAAAMVTLRRSKIVIGIDGVQVTGLGGARHYAYTDRDEVRLDGDDIVLSKGRASELRLLPSRASTSGAS